jgi:hypothetical protein
MVEVTSRLETVFDLSAGRRQEFGDAVGLSFGVTARRRLLGPTLLHTLTKLGGWPADARLVEVGGATVAAVGSPVLVAALGVVLLPAEYPVDAADAGPEPHEMDVPAEVPASCH